MDEKSFWAESLIFNQNFEIIKTLVRFSRKKDLVGNDRAIFDSTN